MKHQTELVDDFYIALRKRERSSRCQDDRTLTADDEEGRERPTLKSHDEATKETSTDDNVDR
jgi:hypothetical protein